MPTSKEKFKILCKHCGQPRIRHYMGMLTYYYNLCPGPKASLCFGDFDESPGTRFEPVEKEK